jgi:hypothetical protein
MYRFTRSVSVNNAASMPAAMQFCNEVTKHLNEAYSLNMKAGAQLFGSAKVYWFFDMDSLDGMSQLNLKLMQDRVYGSILDKAKHLWVEGSGKDHVVKLI